MMFLKKLAYLLPWVRRAQQRDIQDELRSIQQLAGDVHLGNLTLAAEGARGALTWRWIEELGQDLRYALGSMRHHARFTLLVVLSLGLGIGANTAIFSFMESVLLRTLPVTDPQALVIMKWHAKDYSLAEGMSWSTGGSNGDATGTVSSIFPYRALRVFRDSPDIVSEAFGYFAVEQLSVTSRDATDSIKGQYVSGNFFQGIGITPVAGRLIHSRDDVAGAAPAAVISERFERRRFGNTGAAVGQTVRINDHPVLVVGVAPSAFFGAEPGATPDVFLPLQALTTVDAPGWASAFTDRFFWLEVMARLKPGVTLAQAQHALALRFHQFAEALAISEAQRQDLPTLQVESGAAGLDTLRREYARPLAVLMAMVAVILVLACANVANLLLARLAARRREIAIRLSIGAGRARIVRQLLTESLLLASFGGLVGIWLAWWGIDVMTTLLAGSRDNFTLHAAINGRVLGVTTALSFLTGLVFGLVPALLATRVEVLPALKDNRAAQSAVHSRRVGIGSLLLTTQVALSVLLLVCAGLFGRTLTKLHAIDVGFNRHDVLLFTVRPSTVGYTGPALTRLFEDLRVRLGALPGVMDASLSIRPMPMGGGTMAPVSVDGLAPPLQGNGSPAPTEAVLASVGPGFFKTLQMPLVSGRDLTAGDTSGAPRVVVVNQAFARQFGLDHPAALTGRTAVLGNDRFEIVGVADDALAFALKERRRPIAYFCYLQARTPPGAMTYELRTAGDPLALANTVREAVRQVDTRLAIHELKTQTAHIDQAINREITLARLGSWLAVLALIIACVGLYGTVASNVARRTYEIGIRMALGAPAARIVKTVMDEVLRATLAGLIIGLGLSVIGSHYVTTLLYGIEPNDPLTLVLAPAVLLLSGLVAAFAPARRATRIDPVRAMRQE